MKNKATGLTVGYFLLGLVAFINEFYFIATVLLIAFGFIAAISIMKSIKTK